MQLSEIVCIGHDITKPIRSVALPPVCCRPKPIRSAALPCCAADLIGLLLYPKIYFGIGPVIWLAEKPFHRSIKKFGVCFGHHVCTAGKDA